MPKRTSKQAKTTRGAGRPPGSRNKANLVIQDLTAEIAGARGKLRMKWVQGTDLTGKPLFEMRDKAWMPRASRSSISTATSGASYAETRTASLFRLCIG